MRAKRVDSIFILIAALAVSLTIPTLAFSQETPPKTILCAACKYENEWDYNFCISCGASLKSAKEAKLAEIRKTQEEVIAAARRKAVEDSIAAVRKAAEALLENTQAEQTKVQINLPEQEKLRSKWIVQRFDTPAELSRLFNVPVADVLNSLDVSFTGGGAFGIEKERAFLGRAGLGLGDLAEIELSTLSVINTLKKGSSSVPTSAFKMRIRREKNSFPAIAWALRSTTDWQNLQGETSDVSFRTRLTKLYVVASKRVGSIIGHVGMGLTDVRVKSPKGWSFRDAGQDELRRNLWSPFVGLTVRANPKTLVMIEIEGVPQYSFTVHGIHDQDAIDNVWAGVFGVRFYFTNWLAVDTGVKYRSDFDGIADANIQASTNIVLPFGRASRNPRESRVEPQDDRNFSPRYSMTSGGAGR